MHFMVRAVGLREIARVTRPGGSSLCASSITPVTATRWPRSASGDLDPNAPDDSRLEAFDGGVRGILGTRYAARRIIRDERCPDREARGGWCGLEDDDRLLNR